MLEVEIPISSTADPSKVESFVEAACASEGLRQTLKDTLAKYPGCVHWHFKKGAQPGTLEITWWEKRRRLWLKVQAGRRGEWIGEAMPRLRHRLGREMAHKIR
jgi:hypothetical protein